MVALPACYATSIGDSDTLRCRTCAAFPAGESRFDCPHSGTRRPSYGERPKLKACLLANGENRPNARGRLKGVPVSPDWSPEEDAILVTNARLGAEAIAALVPGRTQSAVKKRAGVLRVSLARLQKRKWEPLA